MSFTYLMNNILFLLAFSLCGTSPTIGFNHALLLPTTKFSSGYCTSLLGSFVETLLYPHRCLTKNSWAQEWQLLLHQKWSGSDVIRRTLARYSSKYLSIHNFNCHDLVLTFLLILNPPWDFDNLFLFILIPSWDVDN